MGAVAGVIKKKPFGASFRTHVPHLELPGQRPDNIDLSFQRRDPMSLFRYDPGRELARLRDEIGRFIEPFRAPLREQGPWQPSVDMYESGDSIVLRADLPGIDPKDVDVRVTDNTVSIRGDVRREQRTDEEGFYYSERQYGTFFRSIPLPRQVRPEQSRAAYRNGILEITMPKESDGRSRGYRLEIDTGQSH
jgi:HSP20 family protein